MKNRQYGFTLIELMITIAIIGILAAIAVPQYGSYLRDSRRTDAHIALQTGAQKMERCRTESGFSYATCPIDAATTDLDNSENGYYTIKASNRTATTFTLTAEAITGTPQANDTDCAKMTINEKGVTASTDSAAAVSDCW